MKEVQLFVDCMIPDGQNEAPENSRKVVEFIERVLPSIGALLYVHVIPIRTFGDKEKLVTNGITKLPALLDNQKTFVGLDSIKANVNKHINSKRPKKDESDVLREEQMAEMDMDKYENGEYDDDDVNDDEVFRKGDKDAQKENIQQKIAQFNSRRKGRTEDSKPSKRGSKKKKPTRNRPQQNEDDEPDNVEVADTRPRRDQGGTDLKMEDWDPETQQLLDKAGN